MKTFLILAGLPQPIFDLVRSVPERRFVPHGQIIRSPIQKAIYTKQYAVNLIKATYDKIAREQEEAEASVILAYVAYQGEETEKFVESFFPFALPFPLQPFQPTAQGGNEFNRERNGYVDYLVAEARRSLGIGAIVRKHTNVQNLTPLLLPVKNFRSTHLTSMLSNLFWNLHDVEAPDEFITRETANFIAKHPRIKPPTSDRHCLSDSIHYFKSPGKDRHGFFRNAAAETHAVDCLLNARSRLGGTFPYKFHYDCEPVKGSVAKGYPNCHGPNVGAPRKTHINISPNDYIT